MGEIGETPSMSLEFNFGCYENAYKGEVNALWMRCKRGDIFLIVERGGRVRLCMVQETRAEMLEEEVLLLRSDGICHRVELSEEVLCSLFDIHTSRTSESTTLVFDEVDAIQRVHMSLTFVVSNQDSVVKTMDSILHDSHWNIPGDMREECQHTRAVEFLFDASQGGKTDCLVVRRTSGDVLFLVDNEGSGGEKRVRVGVSYTDDEEVDVVEDDFLVRSDGVSLPANVPDEMLETLFDLDFERTSEQIMITMVDENGNSGTGVCSETYAVSDQQIVIETVSKLLTDSFFGNPPQKQHGKDNDSYACE